MFFVAGFFFRKLKNLLSLEYKQCQSVGRESSMTHLTYWYGFFNDLRTAYSFQKTSQLIPYEEGIKKTEKKLNSLKQKRDAGKKLTKKELSVIKGFEEMERDRPKNPMQRSGYVESNFFEEYHVLAGDEKVPNAEDLPKAEKPKKEKSKSKTTSKAKIPKPKKNKVKKTEEAKKDSEEVEGAQEMKAPKAKKKSPKKKRIQKEDAVAETSRPKKKAKSGDDQDLDPSKEEKLLKETETDVKDSETVLLQVDDNATGVTAKVEERRLSAYEEYQAMLKLDSPGNSDEGSLVDDLSDEDDEDYMASAKPKASKKKAGKAKEKPSKGPTKAKESPKKKVQKTKVKIEKPVGKEEKKSSSESNLKRLYKKEQRKFEKCETEFLPLLRRWDVAIGNKDVAQLSRIYKELLTCMEQFTAPFILEYGMSDLMKRSKGYNNDLRKKVLSKFKEIYKKKNEEVPEGFKATKKSEKKAPPETKSNVDAKDLDSSKVTSIPKKKPNTEKVASFTSVTDKPQEAPKIPLSPNKPRKSESSKDLPALAGSRSRNTSSTSLSSGRSTPQLSSVKNRPEASSQKQTVPSTAKPEKKRFSLGKLMRAGTPTSQPGIAGKKLPSSTGDTSTPATSTNSSKNNQNNPTWIIRVVSNESYSEENRIFGLEFLQQAALYVPTKNKDINYDAIARNIESAIFSWSIGPSNDQSTKQMEECWNKYWNKIHDLAACIGGKRQVGTLAKMIGDGKFATPDELVRLDDEDLWNSFKGLPLSNFSN